MQSLRRNAKLSFRDAPEEEDFVVLKNAIKSNLSVVRSQGSELFSEY